jgi:hypothetical protein
MRDTHVAHLAPVSMENKRLARQVKKFREIFEKSLVKNRAPPYYSPPAAASPATATPPLKIDLHKGVDGQEKRCNMGGSLGTKCSDAVGREGRK